jgi:hypothetical protein
MSNHRIFTTEFAKVYPLYIQKAERKGRTKGEVDEVIRWLTGYSQAGLEHQIKQRSDFETFFSNAPEIHPNAALIKGLELPRFRRQIVVLVGDDFWASSSSMVQRNVV